MSIKAFGIFEGGGARGLAHIGALKASEERSIEFIGVAGTSAGSIVASLIAVGYKADELYDPRSQNLSKGIFDINFLDFFGGEEGWDKFMDLRDQLGKTFDTLDVWKLIPKVLSFYLKNASFLGSLFKDKGLYTSQKFSEWLDEQLARGLARKQNVDVSVISRPVRFRDTLIPLKIIATNLTERKINVYPDLNQQETPIVEAVAASISIPIFFQPKQHNNLLLVDGGLLSNFPAWVFDEELEAADFNTPILGFKLVENQSFPNPASSLYTFLKSLLATALSGDELLETRRIDNLRVIRLLTVKSTFDFKLTREDKDNLYRCGTDGARSYFIQDTGNPFDSDSIIPLLKTLHGVIISRLGNDSSIHLRINVMLPNSKGRLKVFYSYNMDNDADDQLFISQDSLGAGECWKNGSLVVSNVEVVRGNVDKYLQALLRPTLKALMSVPIPDVRRPPDRNGRYSHLLGVLNVDSDNDLLSEFEREDIQQEALNLAVLIAKLLTRKY